MARKKNNNAVTDEQIVSALLEHGTVKDAGAAVGLSPRAVYDRMADGDFQALYKATRSEIVRAAVLNLNNKTGKAIDTIAEIMESPEANPATRLQAAKMILEAAGKFAERLQSEEQKAINQKESNAWGLDELWSH